MVKGSLSRRHFLKVGAVSTFISSFSFSAQESRQKTPLILCSRGELWGTKVLQPAWQQWLVAGNMLDAIEVGANIVELDPEDDSVGYGGLPNENGDVELDASVMTGPGHRCGSVAGLQKIKRASSVARLIMERTKHIMLVGEGAKRFALAHGFIEENLLTENARKKWLEWKENLSSQDGWGPPLESPQKGDSDAPTGTINVLGIDDKGDLFGITTTSGIAFKMAGRVGDSPIIGAGLYVDNEIGAAGATGLGEQVIRVCGSFMVVDKMRRGLSPQQACEGVLEYIYDLNGGNITFNVKFVAVNKKGDVGCAQLKINSETNCSYITPKGFVAIQGTVYKRS
jgi:N4-(beta-N-acetylglucosaminyl)-L-asparaginase